MNRRGFTLVELLVVVAISALLIGVLLPGLAKARRGAQATVCLSQMRQLAVAQAAYATEHKGQLVNYGLAHGGGPSAEAELSWVVDLEAYLESTPVLRSPVDRSAHWATPVSPGGPLRRTSYGLNEFVTRTGVFEPLLRRTYRADNVFKMQAPSAVVQWVVMAFDGDYAASDHVHPGGWWIGSFAVDRSPQLAAGQVQIDAHGGPAGAWASRSNYAYLDGHARTLEFRFVYQSNVDNSFDPRVAH